MIKKIAPFPFGILILVVIAGIMQIPFNTLFEKAGLSAFHVEYMTLTGRMTLIFLVGVLLINKLKEKSLSGLDTGISWSFKLINVIPFYLFVLGILTFISRDLSSINILNVLLLLVACLMVGFAEEFVFRGFLQPLFLKKYITRKNGVFLGVMFPAIFFGASHLLNLTVNDNIPQVIGQSLYAVLIGFFFGVALLKTNKLLPLAITHGLINFFFLVSALPALNEYTGLETEPVVEMTLTQQITSSAITLLIFLPLFIAGLVLLRKIKKEDVVKKIQHST